MSVSNAVQTFSHSPNHAVDLDEVNPALAQASAEDRVAWALERFGSSVVLTSSFGAQAAVCLHLVTRQRPDIPVILVDTGYLFPETYRYIDALTERLELNLKVYRAELSPAWQEARFGRLWEQGVEGLDRYNEMNKVEPMQRALRELGAKAWIAGLRRQQSASRQHLQVLARQNGRTKVHPLVDWTDRDIYLYMTRHELPYHPLWHKGYVSIGDVHTTRPLGEGMTEEDTRFFGLKRECGLHERA
ncbi:phosphoadenylyl-sulfate reductase [Candidatus Macondimonas diazotrophica]|jgi:phosphoadenosine phosphosulfate reductase|uniref:Phosphoadenosine 5'-phosphosulfate reductase n=1 Tax=Candidatus Macondimonas diazotrophica TaxID=2305248 RepID=A0A4Z0F8A8_9GAMM|nr:phosphoadenylyl-sulfate reductase [Candidatus Macondimonas diazotrophica]NCU00817.1 phosphoadenylyl-sulfate reductase [Candidatus Macondimonas diazotrophica]TFZ82582.1 phosphoadenylyl-sulfate reductase [Candidatus Macondimonas diazotrophica]HBG30087.1 phosphoadenosine phosphosulfate reductase [Gammaproteobacteria bacterium]